MLRVRVMKPQADKLGLPRLGSVPAPVRLKRRRGGRRRRRRRRRRGRGRSGIMMIPSIRLPRPLHNRGCLNVRRRRTVLVAHHQMNECAKTHSLGLFVGVSVSG